MSNILELANKEERLAQRQARERARYATSEYKAKNRARCATAEYKAKKQERRRTPEYRIKRQAKRRNNHTEYLYRSLRGRLYDALKGKTKNGSAVRDLGCTIDEFRAYIEDQFLPGMTWNNRSVTGWHLDHIRPLASFDLTDRKQLLQACYYTNYQPLWAEDNLRKGARF